MEPREPEGFQRGRELLSEPKALSRPCWPRAAGCDDGAPRSTRNPGTTPAPSPWDTRCRCHRLSPILLLSAAAKAAVPTPWQILASLHGGRAASPEPGRCPDPAPSPTSPPQSHRSAALPRDTTGPGNSRAIVLLCARLNISAQLLGLHSWEAERINNTSCRNWRQWGDN